MATPQKLTSEQSKSLKVLIDAISNECRVVALSGPAGSGKTTMIQELKRHLGNDVRISAMTNKAAGVLRRKNLVEAVTTHKACLKPILREPAKKLLAYFHKEDQDPDLESDLSFHYTISLLRQAWTAAQEHGLAEAGRVLGFDDFFEEFFEGWGPKEEQVGILIIDEASMLGEELFKSIQSTFSKIILVGDELQLPPVGDIGVFWNDSVVEVRAHLTQVHRQALSSLPLSIANRLRSNKYVKMEPVQEIDLNLCLSGVPIIVWRNKTRIALTKVIRSALGFPAGKAVLGEYLVCRENRKTGKVEFANNSIWKVVEVRPGNSYVLENDDGERTEKGIHIFFEDYAVGYGLNCRFSYSITCHCAQGSEWPIVMVHADDARACLGMLQSDGRKLLYTAVTRAKENLIWVNGSVSKRA